MKNLLCCTTLFFIVFFSACNNNTPKSAAEKFLTALYHYDYASAKKLGTTETKDMVGLLEAFSSNMTDSMRQEAQKITVHVDDVAEQGDTAIVHYTLSDDSTQKLIHLVREQGKWLVSWTKMDAEQEMNNDEDETPPAEETIDTSMSEESVVDTTQKKY